MDVLRLVLGRCCWSRDDAEAERCFAVAGVSKRWFSAMKGILHVRQAVKVHFESLKNFRLALVSFFREKHGAIRMSMEEGQGYGEREVTTLGRSDVMYSCAVVSGFSLKQLFLVNSQVLRANPGTGVRIEGDGDATIDLICCKDVRMRQCDDRIVLGFYLVFQKQWLVLDPGRPEQAYCELQVNPHSSIWKWGNIFGRIRIVSGLTRKMVGIPRRSHIYRVVQLVSDGNFEKYFVATSTGRYIISCSTS